ncbi:HtaA domain-containing protein [Kribbella catacumbae]|uniref:HtaA domain-containing protein n=1 Tax=Kribbella catacumbae TaxID=460086 RepID=UPI00039B1745|nr:HtaA domain-containing protein [Kribbella catacumbae]
MTRRPGAAVRRGFAGLALVLLLTTAVATPTSAAPTPPAGEVSAAPTPTAEQQVWEPKIVVSKTSEVAEGEELTVKGTGFDPAANKSLRVPVTPGEPAGVYVVFGSFAETWKPSTGADATTRTLLDTKWPLPQASFEQVGRDFPNQLPRLVKLNPDGTFELKLKAKKAPENPRNYGVYTYPGGGATNADHELAVPVAFTTGGGDPSPGTPPVDTIDWGLKLSFRTYIEGNIAHGSITLRPPATRNADGTFRFPVGTGGAYFKGHESQPGNPLLEVTVSDLRVKLNGTTGSVIADVISKSLENGQLTTYDDLALADLDFAAHPVAIKDGVATAIGVPAKLTEAGVPAFANFYTAGTALDPVSFSIKLAPTPVWEPKLELRGPDGQPVTTIPAAGLTVTVRGSGFDPAANLSTRPPVTPGLPAGVYVVFGSFDATWRPSENAPPESRRVLDQKWALPDSSRPGGANPAYVTLKPDGTFETTVTVKPADTAKGTYGIATYAAGGATPNAVQELLKPLTFTNPSTPVLTVEPSTDLTDKQAVTVKGSGFAANRALYVAQAPQGKSGESNPSPFSGAQRVVTSATGTFETSVETTVTFRNEGVDVDCLAVPCYLASFNSPLASDNVEVDHRGDRSQDVFRPIKFKPAGPQPVLPAITLQPLPVTTIAGSNVSFTVRATGTPAPSVQWERSDDAGKTWTPISSPSAVTGTLSLTAVANAHFRAVFSNEAGSATSTAAALTVTQPSVKIAPSNVKPGEEIVVTGTGFPGSQKVRAVIDAGKPAEYTFRNASGQSVVVSAADGKQLKVVSGKLLLANGAKVNVRASGLHNSKANTTAAPSGFYVLTAVDNGPGKQASPAIGGADMTGSSGESQWITNFPYAGSEHLVVPIGADLVAKASVKVSSADEHTDCTKAPNGCVLYLRTDHRSTGNRQFDVRVPLQFVASAEADQGTVLGEQTADAAGNISFSWKVPAELATGKHTVTLSAGEKATASADFTVTASSTPTPTPTPPPTSTPTSAPPTSAPPSTTEPPVTDVPTKPTGALASTGGATLWLPLLGALLLITGVAITLATRRRKAKA